MAIIDQLPPKGIIRGYRGTLDFYVNQQRVIVRRWPRKPSAERSPAVLLTLATSAALNRALRRRTACGTLLWATAARSTMWTWRDQVYRYHWGVTPFPGRSCRHLPWVFPPARPYHHFFVYHAEVIRPVATRKPRLRVHYAAPFEVRSVCQSTRPPHRHRVRKTERGQTLHCGYDLHLYPASCGGVLRAWQEPGSTTLALGYIHPNASGWRFYQLYRPSMYPLAGSCVSLSPIIRLWHYRFRLGVFPYTDREYAAIVPLSPSPADLAAPPPADLAEFSRRYSHVPCPAEL